MTSRQKNKNTFYKLIIIQVIVDDVSISSITNNNRNAQIRPALQVLVAMTIGADSKSYHNKFGVVENLHITRTQ